MADGVESLGLETERSRARGLGLQQWVWGMGICVGRWGAELIGWI